MKTIVTGAFSNTGQYLVPFLLEKGVDVIALDLETPEHQKLAKALIRKAEKFSGKLKLVWCDLSHDGALQPLAQEQGIDGIVHLAFIIPPYSETKPEWAREINVNGTRRMLDFAKAHAPEAVFIFASSTTAFGKQASDRQLIGVDCQANPTSQYTLHKIECENLVQNSGLPWRILRFSAIMNPTFRPSPELLEFGLHIDLATRIEPIHILDLTQAVYSALTKPETVHQIFIIAGGPKNQTVYKDYIFRLLRASIGNVTDQDIPWNRFISKPYYLYWYDTEESQRLLQFQSRTIDDFVSDTQKLMPWWEKILLRVFKKYALKFYFEPKKG